MNFADRVQGAAMIVLTILTIILAMSLAAILVTGVVGIWQWAFNVETAEQWGKYFIASLVSAVLALLSGLIVNSVVED